MASRYTFTLEGDGSAENDKKTIIQLKKWSMSKCLSLLKDVGEIAKLLGDDFDLENLDVQKIAHLLATLGDSASASITRLIHASVCHPPSITEDQILEWTLEDYIGVLSKLIEMNLTEGLAKNFKSLRTAFTSRIPKSPSPTNDKQTEPGPVAISSRN